MENNLCPIVTTEARLRLYLTGTIFDEADLFYRDILCLPIRDHWEHHIHDRGVMFDTGSIIIELIDKGEQQKPASGCGLSLAVPDVHKLWRYLVDTYSGVGPLRERSWGDTEFSINDPGGFLVTFFSSTKI